MDALLSSLSERESVLVRWPEHQRLAAPDQEALSEGRLRVRRRRDGQVKIYRGHAALVPELGWRGSGRPKNAGGPATDGAGWPECYARQRAAGPRRRISRDAR